MTRQELDALYPLKYTTDKPKSQQFADYYGRFIGLSGTEVQNILRKEAIDKGLGQIAPLIPQKTYDTGAYNQALQMLKDEEAMATPAPNSLPSPVYQMPIDVEGQQRKKLQTLRMGLASTIKTGTQGVQTNPFLLKPLAFATALKTKLGQ